jgi:hypothetical protein
MPSPDRQAGLYRMDTIEDDKLDIIVPDYIVAAVKHASKK